MTDSIGSIASTVTSNFDAVAKLVTASSYVAGLGFSAASILKFKSHKDNPTQIPIGTPASLTAVAAALLYLPSITSVAGTTMFGSSGTTASDVKAAAGSAGVTSADVSAAEAAAKSAGITSADASAAASAAKDRLSG